MLPSPPPPQTRTRLNPLSKYFFVRSPGRVERIQNFDRPEIGRTHEFGSRTVKHNTADPPTFSTARRFRQTRGRVLNGSTDGFPYGKTVFSPSRTSTVSRNTYGRYPRVRTGVVFQNCRRPDTVHAPSETHGPRRVAARFTRTNRLRTSLRPAFLPFFHPRKPLGGGV